MTWLLMILMMYARLWPEVGREQMGAYWCSRTNDNYLRVLVIDEDM